MKTITLVILALITPIVNFAQYNEQEFFDGEEQTSTSALEIIINENESNIWQIGKPSKAVFDSSLSLPNALVTDTLNTYPTNNSSSLLLKIPTDFFGDRLDIIAIQWSQKLDLELEKDKAIVEFSTDNGIEWEYAIKNPYVYNFFGADSSNVADSCFTGTDSTWKDIWFCFDNNYMSQFDSLMVKFTLSSDSVDTHQDGWMIDNLSIHPTFIHTVNEIPMDEYMQVSPNPTNGIVNIVSQKQGFDQFHIIEDMRLYSSDGKLVRSWQNIPTKFHINIADQPKGIYHLQVKTNLKTKVFQIVKQD